MLFKLIYIYFVGYVDLVVEGFFIERFINICRSQNIFMQDLNKEPNNTYLKVKILKSDFKKIRNIAKKTKCKIKIEKKNGIPFFINKYRKRKIFAIAFLVVAIFIFTITRFIWNVDVQGNEKISENEIIDLVASHGIKPGKLKKEFDINKISNDIRLQRDDISWIGITIKGTNVIVKVQEAIETPELVDKNEICNIIANTDAIISKIIVHSGTARVSQGDEVKKGDLLIEGVMEGVHTGIRSVHAEGIIYGKFSFQKEKKEKYIQYIKKQTGNEEKKNEIYINKFKINLNKGVSKFENYDTISENNRVKLFSNFYLPIQIKKIKNFETIEEKKEYSQDELKEKIQKELEDELENEYKISSYPEENIQKNIDVNLEEDGILLKLTYEVQQEIGTKAK